MKYKILLILVFLSLCADAQFFAGIKVGTNFSNQFYYQGSGYNSSSTYVYSPSNPSNRRTGGLNLVFVGNGIFNFNFGAQAGYSFRNNLVIQTELAYMPTGFILEYYPDYNIKINYLQWNPVVAKFYSSKKRAVRFFVSAGLCLSFPLSAVYSTPGAQSESPDDPFETLQTDKVDLKNSVNSPDGALLVGTGIDIATAKQGKIEIEARYQGGFTSIYKGDFGNSLGESLLNANFILQVGYSLYLSRQ